MIPFFEDTGYLPPGIHPANMAEIEARFGLASELRRTQMQSLHWMMELATRAGVQRIILNGSFVTDILEPNDADCVLLLPYGEAKDESAEQQLEDGLPFLDIKVVDATEFEIFAQRFFANDRYFHPKGLIEVLYDSQK